MKRFMVDSANKNGVGRGMRLASGISALVLASAGIFIGATAAQAVEEPSWTPQSTLTLEPIECATPDYPAAINYTYDVAPGESITDVYIDGVFIPGDTSVQQPAGLHNYTYTIVNLASSEEASGGGSFTVEACEEPATPTASIDGLSATYDSSLGTVVVSGTANTANLPEGATVAVSFTVTGPGSPTIPNAGGGTFTGSFAVTPGTSDQTFQISAQVLVNGSPVGEASCTSVTVPASTSGGGDNGGGTDNGGSTGGGDTSGGTTGGGDTTSGGTSTTGGTTTTPVSNVSNTTPSNTTFPGGATGDGDLPLAPIIGGGLMAIGVALAIYWRRRQAVQS